MYLIIYIYKVSEFPYLNSMTTSDGRDKREIKRCIGMAETAFSKKF